MSKSRSRTPSQSPVHRRRDKTPDPDSGSQPSSQPSSKSSKTAKSSKSSKTENSSESQKQNDNSRSQRSQSEHLTQDTDMFAASASSGSSMFESATDSSNEPIATQHKRKRPPKQPAKKTRSPRKTTYQRQSCRAAPLRMTRNSNRFRLSKPSPKAFYLLFRPNYSNPQSFLDGPTEIEWQLMEQKPVDSKHYNFNLKITKENRKFKMDQKHSIPPSNVLSQLIDFPTTYGFSVRSRLLTGVLFSGS